MQPMTFEAKIKIKDVYAYLMYHMYKGSGAFSILLSIIALVMLIQGGRNQDSMKAMILLFIALFFTVIQPVSLFLKAAQQVTGNPMFQKPITYTFTGEEFITAQGEESMAVAYENIWKIKISSKRVYIYTGRLNASIIPLRDMTQEEREKLVAFLNEKKEEKGKQKNDKQITECDDKERN